LRTKSLPVSVRANSQRSSTPSRPLRSSGGTARSERRWLDIVATLLMVALIPALVLPYSNVEASLRRPTIVGRTVGANAGGVSILAVIAVRFDRPIAGISDKTFVLRDPRGSVVPSTVNYDASRYRAELLPIDALRPGQRYEATLSTAIRTPAGVAISAASWTFRTAHQPAKATRFLQARAMRFAPGRVTGIQVDARGRAVTSLTRWLTDYSWATADAKATIKGRSFYEIADGMWAGYFVPTAAIAHLRPSDQDRPTAPPQSRQPAEPSTDATASAAPRPTDAAAAPSPGDEPGAVSPLPTAATPSVAPATPAPPAPSGPVAGVWIGSQAVGQRPMSGAAWDSIVGAAQGATPNGANLADMNSNHDMATLAAAIVAVRTNNAGMRAKAIAALHGAIGTEGNQRWLDITRNLGGYIIAADLLDVRSGPVHAWISSYKTRTQPHNNEGHPVTLRQNAWSSGSNASAQAGFVHAALAVYLSDQAELAWGWNGFRRYAGDRSSPHRMGSNDSSWQVKPSDPVGIQDAGATRDGHRLDGAIGNDMSRGGTFQWPPGMTDYPWVGLMGAVPAAVVYARAGYPAWTVGDSALLRAATYLRELSLDRDPAWYDAERAPQAKHLLNVAYGLGYPARLPTGVGQTIGFTDWTHPDQSSIGR
jgi:hypothetical protein